MPSQWVDAKQRCLYWRERLSSSLLHVRYVSERLARVCPNHAPIVNATWALHVMLRVWGDQGFCAPGDPAQQLDSAWLRHALLS